MKISRGRSREEWFPRYSKTAISWKISRTLRLKSFPLFSFFPSRRNGTHWISDERFLKNRDPWNAVKIAKSSVQIFLYWSGLRNGGQDKTVARSTVPVHKGGERDVKQEVLVRSPILRSLSLSAVRRNFGRREGSSVTNRHIFSPVFHITCFNGH